MPLAIRRLSPAQQRVLALLADGWEIVAFNAGYVLVRGAEQRSVSTWTVEALIRRRLIVQMTRGSAWVEAP